MKENGDIIKFLRQKDYVMVNNNLGHGSFGKTVVIQDSDINELFVAKKYEPELPEDQEEFFKAFQQEIKIMYKLNHRNIVRIFNYYTYADIHTGYILMEYIDGKNIADYLKAFPPLDDDLLNNLFIQLVDGFQYMEANHIIHRDIREGNIMVDKDGTAKIIDFGLGKVFKPVGTVSKDSMNDIINRSGLDLLPEEYFSGKYDSQTDMFYLAELFRRLLRENHLLRVFSYSHILEKMMKEKRKDRYGSFEEIKEAIGKKDFSTLKITQDDKEIYQAFANALYRILANFSEDRKFITDTSIFLMQMDDVLKNNCLEDVIQKNDDLISCVVSSACEFYPKIEVPIDIVKRFRDWFDGLDHKTQSLVLNNLSYKLSQIKIKRSDDDIPF